MSDIKLAKTPSVKILTKTPQGYNLTVNSESTYITEDGFIIASFYKPYYRNGYCSWDGNIDRLCWTLIKDEKSLYSSMAQRGLSNGTKKSCVSALKYIKEFGELPSHLNSVYAKIENGTY